MSYKEKMGEKLDEIIQMENFELFYHNWHLWATEESACLLVDWWCLVS